MTLNRSFLPFFRTFCGLLIISAALLFISCRPTQDTHEEDLDNKPVIYVSVPPQAFLVKAIAGPEFDVRILIESGQDPHHWLPTPKQTLALTQAVAWFPSGLPFEQILLPKFRSQKNTPQLFPPVGTHPQNHDHDNDPHFWLSPPEIVNQIKLISDSLSQLNPKKAQSYQDRGTTLKEKIETLHNDLTEQFAPYKGRSFLIFHSALGNFAHTYDLTQNVIQSGDASPDPKRLQEIIQQAKQNKIKTVFIQPQFNAQSARMIANALGGQVLTINPLEEDLLANLKHIADTLADAFSQTDS